MAFIVSGIYCKWGVFLEQVSSVKSFGGQQFRYVHSSEQLNCSMHFSIYLPPGATQESPVPVIYWLSGLTCNDENFMQKSGAQAYAAQHNVAIVAPDTSPRGEGVLDDPEGAWDFGLGAGFYVDAVQEPWSQHYRMYSYVVEELPNIIESEFPVTGQRSIMGHSMGGHGALVIGLRNPERYECISAFAPICAPMQSPWGQKAFQNYLGSEQSLWQRYDASCLIDQTKNDSSIKKIPIWIEQGSADDFLLTQLMPEQLRQVSEASAYALELKYREGYDHSYYFIASFISEQIERHAARFLQK